ncbi:hypothetical protein P9112_006456 [Eukaryota sp. TZLM1-RC]
MPIILSQHFKQRCSLLTLTNKTTKEKELAQSGILTVTPEDLKDSNPSLIAADDVWERWTELCSSGKSECTRHLGELDALFSTTTNSILMEETLAEHDLTAQFLSIVIPL